MSTTITTNINYTPPHFEAGLDVWSSEDGTPGSNTYDSSSDAMIFASDQDFGNCLQLFKNQSTKKLRYMGQTPFSQGVYLRVRTRVKVISGPLPSVKISAWAARSNGTEATGYITHAPSVAITNYDEPVEVSAIIGSGSRSNVDLIWGDDVAFAYMGLDITGSNGATVLIENFEIEDITNAYLREMMDWVDVRDFGAVGDGITDDRAAFAAADDAANGRRILVPAGRFYIGTNLSMNSVMRFEGTITMPDNAYLSLTRSFDLPTYIDAFGDEVLGFKKAFQALLNYSDHEILDMGGRRIDVSEPIDLQAAYNVNTSFLIRRVITNGQFYVNANSAWDDETVTSSGTYTAANPYKIRNIGSISAIKPGAIVTGNGVGREVYVKNVNVAANEVELSQPLWGASSTQSYTFTRHKYVLDFGGFLKMNRMNLIEIEFQCNGHASALMLPRDGENFVVQDCFFVKPKNHGITSTGRGCQDLHVDRCQFISNEQSMNAVDRVSVAFNVNANDSKIRNSRFQRMGISMVIHGTGHLIHGNHVFQGDDASEAPMVAGIVFTYENNMTVMNGNYIDNCFIEWNNEHDEYPDHGAEYSFGGMTITGNIFTSIDVPSSFNWIVIKPFGSGHYLANFHVTNNTFRALGGAVERVESVSTTHATLDNWSMRDVTFHSNAFAAVTDKTISPVTLQFDQNSAAAVWNLDGSSYLPFGGNARMVESVVIQGELRDTTNALNFSAPHVAVNQGSNFNQVQLTWPTAVSGTAVVTMRVDRST